MCKQPGHLQFNCPNRKRPSGVKHKNKIRETDENLPSAKLRRIRMIKESDDAQKIRAITDEENAMNKRKNNIITFYKKRMILKKFQLGFLSTLAQIWILFI